ncbi:unnamed protein product [Nezara viridula]|uniref:Uncharacterized protein n=1 Tax=Nezara viridula TaxID=85310 RepID=A0A9P0EAY4_NEZVI|nr:unnamed protein product [Nezara viridula]
MDVGRGLLRMMTMSLGEEGIGKPCSVAVWRGWSGCPAVTLHNPRTAIRSYLHFYKSHIYRRLWRECDLRGTGVDISSLGFNSLETMTTSHRSHCASPTKSINKGGIVVEVV